MWHRNQWNCLQILRFLHICEWFAATIDAFGLCCLQVLAQILRDVMCFVRLKSRQSVKSKKKNILPTSRFRQVNKSDSRFDVPSFQVHIINTLQILFISIAISVPPAASPVSYSISAYWRWLLRATNIRWTKAPPHSKQSMAFYRNVSRFRASKCKTWNDNAVCKYGLWRRKEPQVGDAIIDFRMPRIYFDMQINNGISGHQRESVSHLWLQFSRPPKIKSSTKCVVNQIERKHRVMTTSNGRKPKGLMELLSSLGCSVSVDGSKLNRFWCA